MEKNSKLDFKNIKIKILLIEILVIMFGTFITSLGFTIFLEPHNIVPGGFMGLAKIINDVLSTINFNFISVSLWYIILNLFLYLYAVKCMGIKFAIRAGVGIFSYSLFVELIHQTNLVEILTNQFILEEATLSGAGMYILYAIYGGLLMGAGIGLVFRGNGSTGGSDIVAVVVNKFFPTITTGQVVIAVDSCVVLLSAIAYQSLILPLYAFITIFICGKVADVFVDGVKSLRAYYIITTKKDEMSKMIFDKLKRGATNIKCEGVYTKQDRDMLLVVIRRSQVMTLKKIVKTIDEHSFMISHNVKEVYGEGFFNYASDKKKKRHNENLSNTIVNENVVKNIKENNLKKLDKNNND